MARQPMRLMATLTAAQMGWPVATSFQVSALNVEKVLNPPQSPTAINPTAQCPGGRRWAVMMVNKASRAVAQRLAARVPTGELKRPATHIASKWRSKLPVPPPRKTAMANDVDPQGIGCVFYALRGCCALRKLMMPG